MLSKRQLLCLGASIALGACRDATPKPQSEVKLVRTIVAEPKAIDDDRRAIGEVRPRNESDLGFRIAGKVVERVVDVGGVVKKGDLLARLDDQDHRNKLKSAETDVAGAEAVLIEARAAEGRLRPLFEKGITTRANYEVAVKNLRTAEAKLESAKAALKIAVDQVAYCELRADFDAVATSTGAEAGQVVNAGQTIVRLARAEGKDAVFAMAESEFRDRRKDDSLPEVVVTLLSNPSIVAKGRVREISPVADAVTRTYQVKVALTEPPEQMRLGASVAGRVGSTTVPVVVLPAGALFDESGKPAVWVVDPVSLTVQLKAISISRYETDRILVRSGLAKGDIVVTAGANRLRKNQHVRLSDGSPS